MDGAVWRDPERLDDWIGTLSKTEPVVTFCVYGFHIGCQSAAALRKAGFDARYMAGGHYAMECHQWPGEALLGEMSPTEDSDPLRGPPAPLTPEHTAIGDPSVQPCRAH